MRFAQKVREIISQGGSGRCRRVQLYSERPLSLSRWRTEWIILHLEKHLRCK